MSSRELATNKQAKDPLSELTWEPVYMTSLEQLGEQECVALDLFRQGRDEAIKYAKARHVDWIKQEIISDGNLFTPPIMPISSRVNTRRATALRSTNPSYPVFTCFCPLLQQPEDTVSADFSYMGFMLTLSALYIHNMPQEKNDELGRNLSAISFIEPHFPYLTMYHRRYDDPESEILLINAGDLSAHLLFGRYHLLQYLRTTEPKLSATQQFVRRLSASVKALVEVYKRNTILSLRLPTFIPKE